MHRTGLFPDIGECGLIGRKSSNDIHICSESNPKNRMFLFSVVRFQFSTTGISHALQAFRTQQNIRFFSFLPRKKKIENQPPLPSRIPKIDVLNKLNTPSSSIGLWKDKSLRYSTTLSREHRVLFDKIAQQLSIEKLDDWYSVRKERCNRFQ